MVVTMKVSRVSRLKAPNVCPKAVELRGYNEGF